MRILNILILSISVSRKIHIQNIIFMLIWEFYNCNRMFVIYTLFYLDHDIIYVETLLCCPNDNENNYIPLDLVAQEECLSFSIRIDLNHFCRNWYYTIVLFQTEILSSSLFITHSFYRINLFNFPTDMLHYKGWVIYFSLRVLRSKETLFYFTIFFDLV